MRKLLTAAAVSLLLILSVMPAMALDYSIGEPEGPLYSRPTSVDPVIVVGGGTTEKSNIDRSKNSAIIPPPFGSPESYQTGSGKALIPPASTTGPSGSSGGNNASSALPGANASGNVITNTGVNYYPPAQTDTPAGSVTTPSSNKFTMPDGLLYSDGSLGRLSIPKINLNVKIYETESLESLAKGAGHFKSTSCWDGNVGLAGHNRGVTNHFGRIHTLKAGDTITYTTQLGTRSYAVYFVGKINDTDFSRLERTSENIITLVTCVENQPAYRWCVQAREIS